MGMLFVFKDTDYVPELPSCWLCSLGCDFWCDLIKEMNYVDLRLTWVPLRLGRIPLPRDVGPRDLKVNLFLKGVILILVPSLSIWDGICPSDTSF